MVCPLGLGTMNVTNNHVESLESTHLMGGRKGRARLFPVVPSGQTRGTESKNTQEIPLKICGFLIKSTHRAVTVMVLKHQNRLPYRC